MILVMQCNTNRCKAAHDLLENTLTTRGYDICLVSEPNRNRVKGSSWEVDDKQDVGIWRSKAMQEFIVARGRGTGFVWIDIGAAVVYGCYVSPNISQTDFESYLTVLEGSIRTWSARRRVVLAGDFNSAATE